MNQAMWPDHCLENGDWALPPSLAYFDQPFEDTEDTVIAGIPEMVVHLAKYPYIDAYSAFMDNAKKVKTELDDVLRARSISTLFITGLATDYTVKHTAIDALTLGYNVKILTYAVQGIDEKTSAEALAELHLLGVEMVNSSHVLSTLCPPLPSSAHKMEVGKKHWAFLSAVLLFPYLAF